MGENKDNKDKKDKKDKDKKKEKKQDNKEKMEGMESRIEALQKEIRAERDNLQNGFFSAEGGETVTRDIPAGKMPKQVRSLKGHFGPVYALDWAGEKQEAHICSVSQDAKLIVWNAMTQMKVAAISDANWAMTCAFEQKESNMVAFGGLDNNCYVYRISDDIGPSAPDVTLRDFHQGYLSCCRFIENGEKMLTASGDGRCAYWDVNSGVTRKIFSGHKADVMSLSIHPDNESLFVSASVDHLCKLWDIREQKAVITFEGHESDVNVVQFFPDGRSFASGSDDESCKLFDTRSFQSINTYKSDSVVSSCHSVAFSHSGRILFSAYENETCPIAWDVLKDQGENMISKLESKHGRKVSCLGVSAKGHALASGSWDTLIKIWA